MQPREPLSERTRGKWRGILSAVGVASGFLTGKHGPCPLCGGKDRWRFTDRNGAGAWICNQCGTGDGVELVKRLKQIEFKDAARLVESLMGEVQKEEPRKRLTDEEAKAKMRALWKRGAPVTADSFAGRYLGSRGILGHEFSPEVLRIADHPLMMLAKVVSPDGAAVNVHRTFLAADGKKAQVEKVRMMMEGATPKGSAVRLSPPRDGKLGVAEGIENALSAEILRDLPAWATWSADSLAGFLAPEGVTELHIFADNDANYHGQTAAMTCARANVAKGLKVEVHIPGKAGADWNDILRARPA